MVHVVYLLFSLCALKTKTKKKGRTDDELFGNTDDIFGDIPVKAKSPKVKRGKKKGVTKSGGASGDTGQDEGEGELLTCVM